MATLEGGCSCGAVRYRLKDRPMFTNCCHCLDCQRQTGGAFAINAIIETDRIEVLGENPRAVRMPTDSGRPHDIYRCSKCQVALWRDYGGRPWTRFVRVATLDDPTAIAPDAHIFTKSKQPWVGLPAEAKVFDIFYDMEATWPAQALARRQAAMTAAV
ncbi:MAG TPA: GFA family protein [Caulobacteraceae bacterium]|nr:GFA family protein [Caulobacteraceae bacterium]